MSLQPLAESSYIPPAALRVLLTLVLNKPHIVSVMPEDMRWSLRKCHSKDKFDMTAPLLTKEKYAH